jgi:hypothetical protein
MPKRVDPFRSPKRRLSRAKTKIRRLEKRIKTFFKKEPYKASAEVDADGVTTHALKFTRKIPDSWADSAGEAIEALRAALDQAGYAAAVLGGKTSPKNAYFPFSDTPTALDQTTAARCKDLPPEIRSLFRAFDTHKGGNYALWSLNKLSNANKHRLLSPVLIQSNQVVLRRGVVIKQPVRIVQPFYDREKNEIPLAKVWPGGEFKYDAEFTFSIFLDEFNGVKKAPVVGALDAIAREVQRASWLPKRSAAAST